MQSVRIWLERINGVIVSLAVLAAAMMMAQVTLDVLCKYLFNFPIPLTLEAVSSLYMVSLIFLPLGLVTRDRGHIGVDLFTRNLPRRTRAGLDSFASLLGAAYSALLLYFTTNEALHQTRIGETWETAFGYVEIWPARWLVPLGCILMLAWFVILMVDDAVSAVGRNAKIQASNPCK
ncbi:TRAP transporter small permease [Hoeflea sp. CAU 1731]